jgi:outer membrane protein TolC
VAFNRLVGLQPGERSVRTEEPVTVPLTVYSLDAEAERAVESSADIYKLKTAREMAQWDLDYPWTLDTYGRAVYRTYNVQKYEVDIAGYNLTMAREALKEKVRSTYHDLRALEEQEAALEAAVKTAQDALRVVEAQYRVGLVARDKVREAEAALAEARANLYAVRCQRAAALATWRYLTGRPVVGIKYLS